jgi:hypothetical protein
MPKTTCLMPICMRHRFNVAGATVTFTINGNVPGGTPVNQLPGYADYLKQWNDMRPNFMRPIDIDCETGCRCVKFGNNPTIPNQPAPITLNEWETPNGDKCKWAVSGVLLDTWIGTCALAGGKIRIGDGPWQNVNDIAPGTGFSSALPSGGGHKSGGKKKKKATKRPARKAKASRGRR